MLNVISWRPDGEIQLKKQQQQQQKTNKECALYAFLTIILIVNNKGSKAPKEDA